MTDNATMVKTKTLVYFRIDCEGFSVFKQLIDKLCSINESGETHCEFIFTSIPDTIRKKKKNERKLEYYFMSDRGGLEIYLQSYNQAVVMCSKIDKFNEYKYRSNKDELRIGINLSSLKKFLSQQDSSSIIEFKVYAIDDTDDYKMEFKFTVEADNKKSRSEVTTYEPKAVAVTKLGPEVKQNIFGKATIDIPKICEFAPSKLKTICSQLISMGADSMKLYASNESITFISENDCKIKKKYDDCEYDGEEICAEYDISNIEKAARVDRMAEVIEIFFKNKGLMVLFNKIKDYGKMCTIFTPKMDAE